LKPAAVLALVVQADVRLSISAAGKLKARGGQEQMSRLEPLIREHKDALLAHLKAEQWKQGNGCSAFPRGEDMRQPELREWCLRNMGKASGCSRCMFRSENEALLEHLETGRTAACKALGLLCAVQ
jgi:hypothetical protein